MAGEQKIDIDISWTYHQEVPSLGRMHLAGPEASVLVGICNGHLKKRVHVFSVNYIFQCSYLYYLTFSAFNVFEVI